MHNSEKALITWIYLRPENLMFLILTFMHSLHEDLTQAFMDPIGRTV